MNDVSFDVLDILGSSSLIVQAILVILLIMSLVTWGIVFLKWIQFNKIKKNNKTFLEAFWTNHKNTDQVKKINNIYKLSSLAWMTEKVYVPYMSAEKKFKKSSWTHSCSRNLEEFVFFLESHLSFLATVSSSAPFIGLLGTVWGIVISFQQIAVSGSASLSVVAPGLSEALIATAAGLFSAIPASIAYNFFLQKVKQEERVLENFIDDISPILEGLDTHK